MKRIPSPFILLAALLLFGAAKLPFEQELTRQNRIAFFHEAKLDLALREQIGQGAFIAALSGFRALVADLLWINAEGVYQRTDWGSLALIYNNVTTLQPRVPMFWEGAASQMAYNAAKFARNDPDQPREALRVRAERQYIKQGRDYLERGVRNNPDSCELYTRLAVLLRDRSHDHQAAADAFKKAGALPTALGFETRAAAYELSEVPGKEKEAYAALLVCYNNGRQEWVPTLFKRLRAMEEKLHIPPEQRVYIPEQKRP